MATTEYKTPGVYLVEKNAFPTSVVEVLTAVPVFVGYTEKAMEGKRNVAGVPVRLTAMREFVSTFGGAHRTQLDIKTGKTIAVAELQYVEGARYLLHDSMQLFFANGGGPCYVVSVGDFKTAIAADKLWSDDVKNALERELEPTMVVIPEATQVEHDGWQTISNAVLLHCANMMSRITILDVIGGDRPRPDGVSEANHVLNQSTTFRDALTPDKPGYGVAYYPWLRTTVVPDSDIDFRSLSKTARDELIAATIDDAKVRFTNPPKLQTVQTAADKVSAYADDTPPAEADLEAFLMQHRVLVTASPIYKSVMEAVKPHLNLLPPSAAMAGVYARIDSLFGVFKAPANTGLNAVVAPTLNITNDEQMDLNVPLDGKAINAIRTIPGRGLIVWGARTLDGNSQDWRYVNVRRTMIMLEQSIKAAAQAYVFQPNTATTWVTVQAMIVNYLTNKWKEGALMGTTPEEAFGVTVGLGSTMSGNDILDGYMRVTIKVAIVRPAEFIELTFVQQMQSVA
jgi:phage tail sheath protein FI